MIAWDVHEVLADPARYCEERPAWDGVEALRG